MSDAARDALAHAFARQAIADYSAWERMNAAGISGPRPFPVCQRLLFLQMACEKLCKSHALRSGHAPQDLMTSHAHFASQLTVILREILWVRKTRTTPTRRQMLLNRFRLIARESELLQPSVDNGGRRPDNCEYPWVDQAKIQSPLNHSFPVVELLRTRPSGPMFLKLLAISFEQLRKRLS